MASSLQHGSQRDGPHLRLRESTESAVLTCQMLPSKAQAQDHPATYLESSPITDVAPFRDPYPCMKGNWTLDNRKTVSECNIQKMTVKLQIHTGIKQGHDSLQRFSANYFVSRSHICERALP